MNRVIFDVLINKFIVIFFSMCLLIIMNICVIFMDYFFNFIKVYVCGIIGKVYFIFFDVVINFIYIKKLIYFFY